MSGLSPQSGPKPTLASIDHLRDLSTLSSSVFLNTDPRRQRCVEKSDNVTHSKHAVSCFVRSLATKFLLESYSVPFEKTGIEEPRSLSYQFDLLLLYAFDRQDPKA
jgi:hypothetical protein